jgi:hypothetical protein
MVYCMYQCFRLSGCTSQRFSSFSMTLAACKKMLFGAEKVADHLCELFQAHVTLVAGILPARTLQR